MLLFTSFILSCRIKRVMKLNHNTFASLLQIDIINDIVIQSVCLGTNWKKSLKFTVNKLNKDMPIIEIKKKRVKITSRTNIFVLRIR
mmetsp:Transcript_21641/g.21298  ORF Transcript_21641/g.21298 Transcript_21641/m.21298 type:complete len:87 (-) Transcript_21641:1331-1591(-)